MTRKLLLLFVLLMVASGLCQARSGHLISSTCMADGVEYDTSLPVTSSAATLAFKTVSDEITGYWAICAETIDGEKIIIASTDENIPCSEFVLETDTVEWADLKVRTYYSCDPKNTTEDDYSEHGYELDIEFVSTQEETDNVSIIYCITPRLLPAKPIISGIHFLNEEFDSVNDWFQGDFTFDIYCENATLIWIEMYYGDDSIYFTIDDWKNDHLNLPFYMFFEKEEVDNGHMTYTFKHDWGDVILVRGMNREGGGVYAAPIFTSDYITDVAALARLEELQASVGIDAPNSEEVKIIQTGNGVSAVADGDAVVTLEIVGIDGAKRVAATGRGTVSADLSGLAPGVYVVRATDGESVKTVKIVT